MIRNQKQMFIVIGVFVLTLLLGTVTFAFFNYTRTGTANIIKTGRIYFNSEQGTSINLDNLFPIDPTETGIMNDATKVGTVTINVTGDTTYTGGIEYLVSAVNVQNTVGNKSLPISIDISYSANGNGKVIGTEDEEYFDNRGGNTSLYRVLAKDTITDNDRLVVGYIKPDQVGIDGNIVIKAYIDKAKVGISDTYPEEETDTNSDGYIDGTPASFGENRTVFTTTEWNSLQTSGVSFQIKVESNDSIWVDEILSRNSMMNIYKAIAINDQKYNVKEIHFNKMGTTRMQQGYDAATIKADLTNNNEGKVLAWLETNQDDNTKYNLIIASDGETYFPANSSGLFYNYQNLTKIEFNNINTSEVNDMTGLFNDCNSISELDLSSFNTSNVTRMVSMFNGCYNLTNLDISSFNTENVTEMMSMFQNCTKLTVLDLGNFDTSSLLPYGAAGMFQMVEWNGSAYIPINNLLTTIYVGNNWNVSNVTSSGDLFSGCTSLVGGQGTTYDPDHTGSDYAKVDGGPNDKGYFTLAN